MNFTEFETLMSSKGIITLAEMARALDTTPQAVSNWKARNQVPYHIIAKINEKTIVDTEEKIIVNDNKISDDKVLSLTDIMLILTEQIKVILIIPFIFLFLAVTNEKFIKEPIFISTGTILVPEIDAGNVSSGLMGLASQFGLSSSGGSSLDLSDRSLFPELIRSRYFLERMLMKKFYTEKYNKELSLLSIYTHGDKPPTVGIDTLISNAVSVLQENLTFILPGGLDHFSVVQAIAKEPIFAKNLVDSTISELIAINRDFKNQAVNDKITFIQDRIASVKTELELSETKLKSFNEKNRQVTSSPALALELDRLTRNLDVQKEVFKTLRQQEELAKIEKIQATSVVQILDKPLAALEPTNINIVSSALNSTILGVIAGIILAFFKSYLFNNENIDERKKFRRIKLFFNKKLKSLIIDKRIYAIVGALFTIGLPFYLGHNSNNPVYFGKYSTFYLFFCIIYISIILFSIVRYIMLNKKEI